ncbi:MAG: STAS domain-containing protein [Alphaproteobacteria bacterium]|nr:STAS domain-containing protein [Alphaproteobacteria bacterium]
MEIEKKIEDGMTVLYLKGRIISTQSGEVEGAIEEALKENNKLVLDLKNVDFMVSAGVRLLLATNNEVEEKEGTFIVRNANNVIMEVLKITGLTKFLNIQ